MTCGHPVHAAARLTPWIISLSLALALHANARKKVKASEFGFDRSDATLAVQKALDSGADTVVIDNTGADWLVRPLFVNRSNLKIVFEPGVTVTAKPGGFPGLTDSLFTVSGRSNIVFSGYGATLRMQKQEYATGEWRMVISLLSCTHVLIEGLVLRDSGGDGIYIGVLPGNPQPYCLDVYVRNVVCDNNRRQGISVISAKDLLIENTVLSNTRGTAPAAGIDFEPNNSNECLVNCVVRNTRIDGNAGHCVVIYPANLSSVSTPVSIVMDAIHCSSTGSAAVVYFPAPAGAVEFQKSLFRGVNVALSVLGEPDKGSRITFRNCVWQGTGLRGPVVGGDTPWPNRSAAVDVVDWAVVPSEGNEAEVPGAPAATVEILMKKGVFVVNRTSTDVRFPLAVTYSASGTAANLLDYDGLSGLVVIPARQVKAEIPVVFRGGQRLGRKTVVLELLPSPAYAIGKMKSASRRAP